MLKHSENPSQNAKISGGGYLALLRLMRVKHYIKNLLIFIPAFFGKNILNINAAINLVIAFISFSFAASFVYIINDIRDCCADKKHEIKRYRPIASGEISIRLAIGISIALISISIISTMFLCDWRMKSAMVFLLLYIILNLIYSMGAKKVAVADIIILASGYVFRILYGAAVSNVICSDWLLLTVMSISIYMGCGKRRNELANVKDGSTREVLKRYSLSYLDSMMNIFLAITMVFYALWCVDIDSANKKYNILTLPLVIAIAMKYELDIDSKSHGNPIDVIIGDKILVSLAVCYALTMFVLIYVLRY